jgi:hypothetical protein
VCPKSSRLGALASAKVTRTEATLSARGWVAAHATIDRESCSSAFSALCADLYLQQESRAIGVIPQFRDTAALRARA